MPLDPLWLALGGIVRREDALRWWARLVAPMMAGIFGAVAGFASSMISRDVEVTRIAERQAAVIRRLEVVEHELDKILGEAKFRRQLNDARFTDLDRRLDALEATMRAHDEYDKRTFQKRPQ